MAKKIIEWTQQQKQAILARGSDVLVTASAGTGKTAVLSGRCVDIISDKRICPDVWSILVLTFTEAAAEQMRSRIAELLKDAFILNRDRHLYRQLILLQGADINTIHSFCKRLITEYFYELGLDPTFVVIDGDEQKLLKAETLEKTIDWAWQQEHIRSGLEQLLYRRDLRTNNGFLGKIIEISDMLDGVVSRESWYERAARLVEITDLPASELGQMQIKIVSNKLQDIINQLDHAAKLAKNQGADAGWIDKLQISHFQPVEYCLGLLKKKDWEKFTQFMRDFKKPNTYKPRELSESTAVLIQDVVRNAINDFAGLAQLAIVNPDYLDRLGNAAQLQTRVLIELVGKFDQLYGQAKRAINCLDFADLEHSALKLLTQKDSLSEEALPSDTALILRDRYKHIFVDEYQDINSVQQQILRMLSAGANILEVGDVKQSIYAFRGAEPDIFIEQLKQASEGSGNVTKGLKVDLNANFRSARGILDFVNSLFSHIMTEPFTKIDYDDSAWLRPAMEDSSQAQADDKRIVEFHILDEGNEDSAEQDEEADEQNELDNLSYVTARQRQAAMIARRIKQIVEPDSGKPEFQIFDKQQQAYRNVRYGDIVILMRSLAQKANVYVEVLRLAGVPVSCQATAGYFQATEINDCLALLKVLDNPQRDIELAAVLRSPFFNISDSELAKTKIHTEKNESTKDFYNCIVQYSNSGPDKKLAAKLTEILARIEDWRSRARGGSIADLIWQIYRLTGYLSFVCALPSGQVRRANLLKLHERAIQFENFAGSAGIASLTRFVSFIEKLQESGQDWAPAEPQSSAGDAVRILSVHKSKGLEFPVVFLADLNGNFNKNDVQTDCLADTSGTLGLQIIDQDTNSKLSTLAHEVVKERKLATMFAEEMRILYVAATRAIDRLILVASYKKRNCRKIITNGFYFGDGPVPGWQLRGCKNPLEWILYGFSRQKNLHEAFETSPAGKAKDDDLFDLTVYDFSKLKKLSDFVIGLKKYKSVGSHPQASLEGATRKEQKNSDLLEKVKKSLAWKYPFGDAPHVPAKISVSRLSYRNDEYIKFDYSGALDRLPQLMMTEKSEIEQYEPRLIGTATHLVISQLDLKKPVTSESIEMTKQNLSARGALAADVAEQIDVGSILEFYKGELGRMLLDPANGVLREWPFTYALKINDYNDIYNWVAATERSEVDGLSTNDENIIVQGIIDLLVQTPQGLVVVDFKTDRISAGQVAQRAENYRRQLELYGRAASEILKSKVVDKWLYFLNPRISIKV